MERIRKRRGITVFELLVSVLIMAFVFLTAIGGVTSATRVYRSLQMKNAAQTFLNENIAAVNRIVRYDDPDGDIEITRYGNEVERYTVTSESAGFRGYFAENDGTIRFVSVYSPSEYVTVARNLTDTELYAEMEIDPSTTEETLTYRITVHTGDSADGPVSAEAEVTVTPQSVIINSQQEQED